MSVHKLALFVWVKLVAFEKHVLRALADAEDFDHC